MAKKTKKKHSKEIKADLSSKTETNQNPSFYSFLLIIAAFFSGASIMIIELAANRVLAPLFGNSLYTWTAIIGVILVAMSCGQYIGGWLVDKRPEFVVLFHLLLAASFFTSIIPLLQNGVNDLLKGADLISAPIFASIILFTLPGCLLATISPFAIRLISLLKQDKQIGSAAGSISMFATLGSVIGTFGAGFILIPQLSINTIFLVIAGTLTVLALIGYKILRQKKLIINNLIWLVPLSLFLWWNLANIKNPPNVLFNKTNFYHRVRITEKDIKNGDKLTRIFLDSTLEGAQYKKSRVIPIAYQRYWQLATTFIDDIEFAAFLGAGGYAMPEALLDHYTNAQVDVVEIDPQVLAVGKKYFRVDEYPRMTTVVDDARHFFHTTDKKYDLVFGDAYNGVQYIPAHLVTTDFFSLVKEHLTDKGIFMMNVISALRGEKAVVFQSIAKTVSEVFDNLYIFKTPNLSLRATQNIIIIGSARDLSSKLKNDGLKQEVTDLLDSYLKPSFYDFSEAKILTDDQNPIEYYVAQSLNRVIHASK